MFRFIQKQLCHAGIGSPAFRMTDAPCCRRVKAIQAILWPGLSLLLSACSGPSYFADTEDALGTSGYFHKLDHISAYYPSAISLNFHGYVVSLEESRLGRVTHTPAERHIDRSVIANGQTIERLLKSTRYYLPYVSQVMRYEGLPYGEGNCSLYSLYHNRGSALVKPCPESPIGAFDIVDYRSSFGRSWNAIDILGQNLARDVASGRYSHVVVAVMGLDTPQADAIRNYKSIISSIRREAGSNFEPLFVGITWPSFFANRWFDPFWEVIAYYPIADRADILGLTWLGILLNEAVLPLSDRIEVNVIAHSFGARAASMGLCVGPALLRPDRGPRQPPVVGHVDTFIGLAPAFSLHRFVDKDYVFYESVHYPDYCPRINRFVFTASSNDHAYDPVFWNDAVGDHDYMLRFCAHEQPVDVTCVDASADGTLSGMVPASKIVYIDTSALMRYQMPETKGGGHSDIYRPAIGRLLWQLLNTDEP